MTPRKLLTRGVLAAVAVATVACSSDHPGPTSPLSPGEIGLSGTPAQYVDVYKIGPAGTYSFDAIASGGYLYFNVFSVEAGSSRTIWTQTDPLAAVADVAVTEDVQPGMQVDSIVIYRHSGGAILERIKLTGTNTAVAENVSAYTGAIIKFYNSLTPPPPDNNNGGEGCTPGYWKQPHHFDSWVGYSPNDLFSSVFADAFPGMTLLDVVKQGGGGLKALGRHTVAALLNTSNAGVSYGYTTQGVVDAFNAAYSSGAYESQKNLFEAENEMGCPLN